MPNQSPDRPRDCSSCRHRTQVLRAPVAPGSIDDSVEDTLVNFEDETRPYYFCHAPEGPRRGDVGFKAVTCEAFEAPSEKTRNGGADAIMARYEARIAAQAKKDGGEEEEEAPTSTFSKTEQALIDGALEHVGKYTGTVRAVRSTRFQGATGVHFMSSVTSADSGGLSWEQLRVNTAEQAGALIVACFERRW